MSVISGYLTKRLFAIWDLNRGGISQVDIASRLGITRQAVNQAVQEASERVARALTETAEINKISAESLDSAHGILVGWSREFSVKAVISMTKHDGMQVWYEHVADCDHCNKFDACRGYLIKYARERNRKLTKDEKKLVPSKLAQRLLEINEA
jgi:predicted transcriptional regulator